jgi:hypothetical protein
MEQRVAFRFPTDVEAECRSCHKAWASRLVNISTTGCMIACPEPDLPDKALLRLRVKGLTAIDGEIVWQHRNHAGVRFSVPLHPAVIEHLAFGASDRGCEDQPGRVASSLHGQLIKRQWQGEGETSPSAAS